MRWWGTGIEPIVFDQLPSLQLIAPATLASGAAFALPALSLFLPSGYSWGALLLVIFGLLAWRTWLHPARLPLELKAWALTVALAGCVWTMHLMGSSAIETRTLGLDRLIKYGLALLAIPAMLGARLWPRALALGCWAGAGLAGVIAIWDVTYLHLPRAEGHTNAIHFGNIALLLATWTALWALHTKPKHPTANTHSSATKWSGWKDWLACGLGLSAMVLSGSRGGWMAVPFLGALIAWQWRCGRGIRNRVHPIARWLLVAATTLALLLVTNMPSVKQRIQMAQDEWTGWVQTGESNNSVGQRLAHWQFAWQMFTQKPLTGWGQIDYDEKRIKTINEGHTPESLRHFNHAHNEWLDMAAKRGAVGLLGLAVLFGVPSWLYIRRMRQDPDSTTRTLALCGLATVLGYLVFGLTQVMFAHNAGNMIYLFMNTLWLGALAQQQQEPGHA